MSSLLDTFGVLSVFFWNAPVLVMLVLWIAACLTAVLPSKGTRLPGGLALGAHFLALVLTGYLAWAVLIYGELGYSLGGWLAPWGIEFMVTPLSVFMLITIFSVSTLILFFSLADLHHDIETRLLGSYYTLYLLLVGALAGLCVTNDLFNMFVLMEVAAIGACGIIAVKGGPDCTEASLKYLILSCLGTGGILLATALLYKLTGHLNIDYIAAGMDTALAEYPINSMVALALFSVGFIVKAALFPLHVWLPDAHSSAPSPSSALLSGLVIKVYAVLYLRILVDVYPREVFLVLPVSELILILASISIIVGSLYAMAQTDIKRMLAYSSIAQIGYVFLGIGLMQATGITGGLLHIFNHAMMKSMLFLSAGAIIYCTGIRTIKDMKGIGLQMPLAMSAFTVGAMAMVGIPATNGFISKLYLALGAFEAGRPVYLGVILLSSLLNGIYYFPIVIGAFFGQRDTESWPEAPCNCKRLPLTMAVPLLILAVGCVFFGIFPMHMLVLVEGAVALMLP
ncbi:MAG: hypothetical protein LC641_13335 [Spirochaeta sp.]|nr:hypothetical protein [Spirochaeta sp.]